MLNMYETLGLKLSAKKQKLKCTLIVSNRNERYRDDDDEDDDDGVTPVKIP